MEYAVSVICSALCEKEVFAQNVKAKTIWGATVVRNSQLNLSMGK